MSETTIEEKIEKCPDALQAIIQEFREATPRERLEMLIEFSDELPELPERLHTQRDSMEQVHECQSPVFLHTELEGDAVQFYIDIPREAPTVRGYAGVLVEGLDRATTTEILRVPADIYMLLGLQEAITPQRLRGLHALVVYMKRQVQRLASAK